MECSRMSPSDWKVPPSAQPKLEDYAYDLDHALGSVVGIRSVVPADAFSAETLGTERAGNGVLIREDGVVLTIGYLITEAESVWLTFSDGRAVQGHALGYDQETGFGLVQALARLDLPALPLGQSSAAAVGDNVVVGGAGGRHHSVAAQIAARQEFAGYWEYVLDEAIFTAPAHPNWGGTALIGPRGDLVGIGSLPLQHQAPRGAVAPLNMRVPIDLLKPILDDLLTLGRTKSKPRPCLGFYVAEAEDDQITVIGLAGDAPAQRAGPRAGEQIHSVAGQPVTSLAEFYRAIWALGAAGVDVPMTLEREGDMFDVTVRSA